MSAEAAEVPSSGTIACGSRGEFILRGVLNSGNRFVSNPPRARQHRGHRSARGSMIGLARCRNHCAGADGAFSSAAVLAPFDNAVSAFAMEATARLGLTTFALLADVRIDARCALTGRRCHRQHGTFRQPSPCKNTQKTQRWQEQHHDQHHTRMYPQRCTCEQVS